MVEVLSAERILPVPGEILGPAMEQIIVHSTELSLSAKALETGRGAVTRWG